MDEVFSERFPMPAPKPRSGGMFGAGGAGRSIAGAIGDYLLQMNRMQPIYGPAMEQHRLMQMRQQEYDRQRQDSMADWQAQQQWKMEHPGPINNDTVNDYNFITQQLGEDAGKEYLRTKTSPIVMTPYGPMPYSAVNGGGPARPVGKLTPIDGGPTPQASGGFPSVGY